MLEGRGLRCLMEEYSREEGRGKLEDVGPAQMVGW